MKNKFGRGLLAASALAVLLAAGFQGPAVADDLAPPPASLIDSALDDVDAPAAQANDALEIPKNAANTVDYTDAELSLGLDIPASGRPATDQLRMFSAAKILKIRKIIKAAGGVKSAASRVIKGISKKGSLSTKAKAGFGDLGGAVVAAAVVVLDIDSIKSHCG